MDENTSAPLERRCPTCGASMSQDARFCGACGSDSLPASAAPAAAPTETLVPPPPSPPAVLAETPVPPPPAFAAPAPSAIAGGRICPWCDAPNPPDGARCVACGAVFPTPEGNEALERAARARIQSMEADIKPIRAGWWPFGPRGPASDSSNSSGSNGV